MLEALGEAQGRVGSRVGGKCSVDMGASMFWKLLSDMTEIEYLCGGRSDQRGRLFAMLENFPAEELTGKKRD